MRAFEEEPRLSRVPEEIYNLAVFDEESERNERRQKAIGIYEAILFSPSRQKKPSFKIEFSWGKNEKCEIAAWILNDFLALVSHALLYLLSLPWERYEKRAEEEEGEEGEDFPPQFPGGYSQPKRRKEGRIFLRPKVRIEMKSWQVKVISTSRNCCSERTNDAQMPHHRRC